MTAAERHLVSLHRIETMAIALCETHMELLRGFYKPHIGRRDAFTGEINSDAKMKQLLGDWDTQTEDAKRVYRELAKTAIITLQGTP